MNLRNGSRAAGRRLVCAHTIFQAVTAVAAVALIAGSASANPPHKFLFDATKAEMAGNADWVVDADLHNIGTGSGGVMTVGAGSDSNPQRFPTGAASGITASTPETYWTGALSSWGVELVKRGMQVETLPYNGQITYGNASNPQDLSNYAVFVMCEPNTTFTATEKAALVHFVQAGGGLFLIADHNASDRNNDGVDSLHVLNDFMATNGVAVNPFGFTFNADSVSPTGSTADTSASDPITRGPAGNVSTINYSSGCTITISTAANPTVRGAIWSTATHSSSNVQAVYSQYGAGRIVAVGDSSPFDDGTGDSNDTLYTGWTEVSGDHARMIINASLYLDCNPPAAGSLLTRSISAGQSTSFTVTATGTGTLSYQWRKNGSAISNGGVYSGVTTPTLTVTGAAVTDAGDYSVLVSNTCGSVATPAATLTVTGCPADLGRQGGIAGSDGLYDNNDFIVFINDFFASDAHADMGRQGGVAGADGQFDNNDFIVFINLFFTPCP